MAKNRTLIIDQCYFGEKDRGHGLLKSTITDRELSTFLSRISDLPISKPADLQLEPFYGCHKYLSFLIFTKTFINKLGSRPGLVFTHALIIDSSESRFIGDLNQVFNFFVESIPNNNNNVDIYQTEIELEESKLSSNQQSKALLNLVNFLLHKKDDQVCVLSLNSSMPELYISLWNSMLPELRNQLAFRLAFTYSDTHADQYQIYLTPQTLLPKWPNETHIENYTIEYAGASLSLKLLISSKDADPLKDFMVALNYSPINFNGFSLCEKAFDYYKELSILNERKILQLIRLVVKLSPVKNEGKTIKARILNKLIEVLNTPSVDSLLLLSFSNMNFSTFNDTGNSVPIQIQKQITNWWNDSNFKTVAEILQRRLDEENMTWWTDCIDLTFETLLKKVNEVQAKAVWFFWTKLDLSVAYLEEKICATENIQKNLVKTIPPDIQEIFARQITKLAQRNKWFLLHANLLISYLSPERALREHLKIVNDDKLSLNVIANVFEPIQFLQAVMGVDNITLMEIAVDLTVSLKKVVKIADVSIDNWQYYINQKLKQLLSKRAEVYELEPFVFQIWDRLICSQSVSEELLISLSISPFNNLCNYEQRKNLWGKLPNGLRNRFLTSTGKVLLEKLPIVDHVEPILQTSFIDLNIAGDFMNSNAQNWSKILNVFDYLNNLPEQYLIDHLNYTNQNISFQDSIRLGKLVSNKRWRHCADKIYDKAKIYDGYKIALSECGHLLDFWRRLKINYTYSNIPKTKAVSESEWLLNFEELCNEIYHEENEIRIIWKRAEGDVSDLKSKESARVIWHSALNNIQKGKMHGMTFKKLVSQMATENPAKRNKFNMLLNSLNELPNLSQ